MTQYLRFWEGISRGELGPSTTYPDRTVSELIADGLPVTLKIGLISTFFAAIIGVVAGIYAAQRRNSWADYTIMGVSSLGLALPNFVIAPFLTFLFGIALGVLPVAGWGDGSIQYWILPVTALALPQITAIARIMRGSMLETLSADYVRTARAKGLSESRIVWRHVFRAALLPVVSYLGPALAGVMTGSVIIEQLFSLPGVGRFFVQGAVARDYQLVLGVVILYSTTLIILNLLVDLIYGWLDPRVRVR
ncbi:ABC transporter permease [Parasphingorhabdus sp.]|uniref:ABC transporter permease n=1 Tax=Parasphingorhabdus sp. TaxID=2709688 RepID=UPI003A8F1285